MKKTIMLAIVLLMSLASFAQTYTPCASVQRYQVSNAWSPSQQIQYGLAMELFNPIGSGCDLYIEGFSFSAGSNKGGPDYFEFGTASTTAILSGCSSNLQIVSIPRIMPAMLPGNITGVGQPGCLNQGIGLGTDGRWTLASGHVYDEDFDEPRLITSGFGYSVWTSFQGYPAVQSVTGDLTVTFRVKICPAGSTC